jgi:hypothetical protein
LPGNFRRRDRAASTAAGLFRRYPAFQLEDEGALLLQPRLHGISHMLIAFSAKQMEAVFRSRDHCLTRGSQGLQPIESSDPILHAASLFLIDRATFETASWLGK